MGVAAKGAWNQQGDPTPQTRSELGGGSGLHLIPATVKTTIMSVTPVNCISPLHHSLGGNTSTEALERVNGF